MARSAFGKGIKARLVWDGGEDVKLPPEYGEPRDDQLQGTTAERLSEVCGRGCYHSFGRGRPSSEYHENILKYQHYSIYEHYHLTVRVENGGRLSTYSHWMRDLINRPGVWVEQEGPDDLRLRITFNLRVILDWWKYQWFRGARTDWMGEASQLLYDTLAYQAQQVAPAIIGPERRLHRSKPEIGSAIVEPRSDHERWLSLFLRGSRGMSHEQVRHGDFTAISQRSTRYKDEDGTPWIVPPAVQAFTADDDVMTSVRAIMEHRCEQVVQEGQTVYRWLVEELEDWLRERGVPKIKARKAARGAARGYLGNGLETDMIFSASLAQWKWMTYRRAAGSAEPEIRLLYADHVVPAIKGSRYGEHFAFEEQKVKDGIGKAIVPEEWA